MLKFLRRIQQNIKMNENEIKPSNQPNAAGHDSYILVRHDRFTKRAVIECNKWFDA